jgi:uncharacterized phage protein (TIGR01671 family)
MREIKFRLYSTEEEEMFFNENIVNIDLVCNFARIENERFKGFFDFGEGEESILMQYTGLKDKNGKEIYEGDILKLFNDVDYIMKPGYAKIVFEDGAFCCKHFKYGTEYLANMDVSDMDITVAGNIYENPNLLEGAK